MGRVVTFTIPGRPRTKNARKAFVVGGKARVVESKRTRKNESDVRVLAAQHAPDKPFSGPVCLKVVFCFVPPKSTPKWKREAMLEARHQHVKRPDIENMVKLVNDALQGVFYHDDSQVMELEAAKEYGEVNQTVVTVREIEHIETREQWIEEVGR